MYNTSRAGQEGGADVSMKKTISQRRKLPIECAQGDQPLRCPNRVFWVDEASAVPWWWCGAVLWCGWLRGISNVIGCEVTWGEVMWLVARCHVMWCDVMWCHVIWGDVISCVVLCHVMQCHDAMWCVLMWWAASVVKWCGATGCDLMSLWWDVAGCDVTSCGSKWLCDVVNWKMSWWSVLQSTASTTQYHKVLQSTTPYSKIQKKNYSVLHSTTKY